MKVKWKQEEIDFVKENANHMSTYDIGLKLGRSARSVMYALSKIGVKKNFVFSNERKAKSKGYNDNKYIGNSYGEWTVIKRVKSNQKKPQYLCQNLKGDERIFKQEHFKRIINNKEIPILPLEDLKETKYKDVYIASSGNAYKRVVLFNGKSSYIKYSYRSHKEYPQITITDNGKRKNVYIHRLVAEAFIPNPNNYPIINHKDENKQNNNVENLEWCSYLYNNTYGNRIKKARETFYENRLRKQRQMA